MDSNAQTRRFTLRLWRSCWCLLCLFVVAAGALAQTRPAKSGYEPRVGQEGKDVVWVPTTQALVDKMLDLAQVTAADYVIDLGSGDGRAVIAAARRGARALGIEYNADLVELSKRNAAREGVGDRVHFVKADIFTSDLSQATVVTMFLLPSLNFRMRPRLLELKPGTRIVSNTFTMDDWPPDEMATAGDSVHYHTALLWIVPANVEGTWQTSLGELALRQNFQTIEGTLSSGGNKKAIANGRLRGDRISFTIGDQKFAGRAVNGTTIEGSIEGGDASNWSATRPGRPVR